mmetsp:Transcript_8549/g.14711  ORF Transcript_8549/g.14711 Transcript_8549/m.14711 type:complete len:401 (+) Transcript_8549:114-1316(+)|eukprot:CAMPEP_0196657284 /NCGR_PEP_ID=MMETSP1086-20130531/22554_1 /TAXON_ID=77921 /ORGANISM="Cyanoptyche  gloeocystis , Strain SAG4.97" /LENGTH=400 /DNA_ID=CAMNT_0041990347 /DNA_START=101 /DNA_END=1303 /DNA_ORIENTATION=-
MISILEPVVPPAPYNSTAPPHISTSPPSPTAVKFSNPTAASAETTDLPIPDDASRDPRKFGLLPRSPPQNIKNYRVVIWHCSADFDSAMACELQQRIQPRGWTPIIIAEGSSADAEQVVGECHALVPIVSENITDCAHLNAWVEAAVRQRRALLPVVPLLPLPENLLPWLTRVPIYPVSLDVPLQASFDILIEHLYSRSASQVYANVSASFDSTLERRLRTLYHARAAGQSRSLTGWQHVEFVRHTNAAMLDALDAKLTLPVTTHVPAPSALPHQLSAAVTAGLVSWGMQKQNCTIAPTSAPQHTNPTSTTPPVGTHAHGASSAAVPSGKATRFNGRRPGSASAPQSQAESQRAGRSKGWKWSLWSGVRSLSSTSRTRAASSPASPTKPVPTRPKSDTCA